jgi:hypothetical protein
MQHEAPAIVITLDPGERPGSYRASLDGKTLCISRQPFFTAARELIARGFAPDAQLAMCWRGSSADALRGRLGLAAGLTVSESERGGPRIVPHRADARFPCRSASQEARFASAGLKVAASPSRRSAGLSLDGGDNAEAP